MKVLDKETERLKKGERENKCQRDKETESARKLKK
jgi:hypothetical protein